MSELFDKSIRTLELPRVLQLLSEQAVSPEAKELALAVRPETDYEDVLRLLDQTDGARAMIVLRGAPGFSGVKPVKDLLDRADRGGSLNILWRTPAPTAVAPIPSSRISTFCRAFSAAGPAERGAGVFHCVGIHWPPCGTSFTATPSGFIPSHWDRRPKSGCPLPPKPLSPPSWSGDSGRWTSIRVSGAWMSHPD